MEKKFRGRTRPPFSLKYYPWRGGLVRHCIRIWSITHKEPLVFRNYTSGLWSVTKYRYGLLQSIGISEGSCWDSLVFEQAHKYTRAILFPSPTCWSADTQPSSDGVVYHRSHSGDLLGSERLLKSSFWCLGTRTRVPRTDVILTLLLLSVFVFV